MNFRACLRLIIIQEWRGGPASSIQYPGWVEMGGEHLGGVGMGGKKSPPHHTARQLSFGVNVRNQKVKM